MTSVLHPSKHLWILNCYCGARYFSIFWIVLHISCMNWINTFGGHWSHEHCFGSISCGYWWAVHSIFAWNFITDPLVIKKNYFTWSFISSQLKFIKSINNKNFSSNWAGNRSAESNYSQLSLSDSGTKHS